MTNRERVIRTLQCLPADRPPFVMWLGFEPWPATLDRWRRESGIADLGSLILAQTGNKSLVITLAERGLMIFDTNNNPMGEECRLLPLHEIKQRLQPDYLPSFANLVADPMGAGDAMLATISCCLAAGAKVCEAVFLGNCASAVACRKMGNVPVRREEILEILNAQIGSAA